MTSPGPIPAPTTAPRVLLLGANGQLGAELRRLFSQDYELRSLTRAEADLAQPDQVAALVAGFRPAIILNAAAYTAVDRAESEPELAHLVNAVAPGVLAAEAARYGGLLVHYSTDYVFDGSKTGSWNEDDPTAPLNAYGATKLAGEQAIAAQHGAHLIFRTSWVFAPHGKNFLLTILRLAGERDRLTIVADQHGAPTSALAIARATAQVLGQLQAGGDLPKAALAASGVYHMTCAGETTWHGFAQAIVEQAARDQAAGELHPRRPAIDPISASQYPTPARRPANSMLDNAKLLRRFGTALPPWREALAEAVFQLNAERAVARP